MRDLGVRDSEAAETEAGARTVSRLIDEYLEILQRSIAVADVVTIAIAGALSYLLAGRTLRPIRDSVRSQREFYANAAHDLRTPLAVMKTEAEVALRDPRRGAVDSRRILESSLEEIDRMSAMVEEMLLLSTYGAGGGGSESMAASRREESDLADLAATAVERMRSRAEAKGVALSASVAEPVLVRLDARAVERALANVLENAVKYTREGGSVSVSLRPARGHVDVVAADTGIGIPAADLPRVADPFFRADGARAADDRGAGLGLAIVRRIMVGHGGSLEIASAEGKGTIVRLRFPR